MTVGGCGNDGPGRVDGEEGDGCCVRLYDIGCRWKTQERHRTGLRMSASTQGAGLTLLLRGVLSAHDSNPFSRTRVIATAKVVITKVIVVIVCDIATV
jgi:hypothetical protein